jgi:phage-related protein
MEVLMPKTKIVFYKESDGNVPLLSWLDDLKPVAAADKCIVVIKQLSKLGYELRRPQTDILRDGIRELRTRLGSINYRILYFFHDRNVVVLTHGLTKEGVVPNSDIDKAINMKQKYHNNPEAHSYVADLSVEGRIHEKD